MEQKLLNIKILTPEQTIFVGETDMVIIPGEFGELGILSLHTPLISSLRDGIVKIFKSSIVIAEFVVFKGYGQVFENEILILTELALNMLELDIIKIKHNIVSLEAELQDIHQLGKKNILLQDLARNKLIIEYLEKQ